VKHRDKKPRNDATHTRKRPSQGRPRPRNSSSPLIKQEDFLDSDPTLAGSASSLEAPMPKKNKRSYDDTIYNDNRNDASHFGNNTHWKSEAATKSAEESHPNKKPKIEQNRSRARSTPTRESGEHKAHSRERRSPPASARGTGSSRFDGLHVSMFSVRNHTNPSEMFLVSMLNGRSLTQPEESQFKASLKTAAESSCTSEGLHHHLQRMGYEASVGTFSLNQPSAATRSGADVIM
jgi:hypothetical protein